MFLIIAFFDRISVKQEESPGYPPGLVSNYFHNKIDIGSKIEVVMPCGTFVLKTSERDVVLIAGTHYLVSLLM